MAIDRTLVDILEETADALSKFDLEKLNALEQRIVLLAESNTKFARDDIGVALQRKRQLEIILKNCQKNLDALNRLHARNMRNQWAQ
jgi:primosomal protein N''